MNSLWSTKTIAVLDNKFQRIIFYIRNKSHFGIEIFKYIFQKWIKYIFISWVSITSIRWVYWVRRFWRSRTIRWNNLSYQPTAPLRPVISQSYSRPAWTSQPWVIRTFRIGLLRSPLKTRSLCLLLYNLLVDSATAMPLQISPWLFRLHFNV